MLNDKKNMEDHYSTKRFICFIVCIICMVGFFSASNAEDNDADVLFQKGYSLLTSDSVTEEDVTEAVSQLEESALLGNKKASILLGMMYEDGVMVEQDYPTALKWYDVGAMNGSVQCMYKVGYFFKYGLGTEIDTEFATQLFEIAAMYEYPDAMEELGTMYLWDSDDAEKRAEGIQYLEKAAALGNQYAMINLAFYYEYGIDMMPDYTQAQRWLEELFNSMDTDVYYGKGNGEIIQILSDILNNKFRKFKGRRRIVNNKKNSPHIVELVRPYVLSDLNGIVEP